MAKGITVPVTQTGLSQSIQNAVKQVGGISVPVDIDSRSFKNLSQPLGRITGLATEFEKSIAASNARVIAFGASVGIINGIQGAFAELLRTGIEVQKILADIAAISGQSGAELSKFGDSIFNVAKNTSQSFKVAAQAALEFSRQGLSTDETIRRTNDALTLVRFTTLNAAEAVDVLTAATNSFSETGITTSEILNKLVAVDTKFAVSAEDLANGLARAGSIAQEVGVSFDELNAAITITQERTARGGAVIGNALKTIFTRLRSDETVNALRSIGVESLNAQGGLKGAIPLLQEVATKIESLSGGERVQILEAIASKYNINILSALLNDLNAANGKFAEVVQISGAAQNQAYERQIELNKTLAAQINLTTVSVTQLFNKLSEIGVTESLTSILKFVNDLLDGFNKLLDSETTGGNIAKGLIKGISDIFFSVGLPIIGAIFIKLTKDIAQFGVESLKTILGINQQVRERQALEQAVVNTLIKDRDVMASILALSGDRAKQEEYLLNVYNRQISALERVQSIATSVAPALVQGGLSATSGTVKRRAAEGYLPAQEAADVKRGVGGADRNAKVVKIPNFSFGGGKKGTMYANTSEYIVPNFNGGDGTAIFNKDMVRKYGVPENAKKINAATGYIPNFAEEEPKQYSAAKAKELETKRNQIINNRVASSFGRAAMLVQNQDQARSVQGDTGFGVKPKANVAKFGRVRFPVYGLSQSGLDAAKLGIMPKIEEPLREAAFNIGVGASSELSGRPVNLDEYKKSFKKSLGSAGSFTGTVGGIFEAASRVAFDFQSSDTNTLDVPVVPDEMRIAFGITGGEKSADIKGSVSDGVLRKFADQVIDNNLVYEVFQDKKGATAARGYIPNFAEETPKYSTAKAKELAKKEQRRASFNNRVASSFGIAALLVKSEAEQKEVELEAARGKMPKIDANYERFSTVKFPVYGLKQSGLDQAKLGFIPQIEEPLRQAAFNVGLAASSEISGRQVSPEEYKTSFKKSLGGAGAFGGTIGSIFESAARTAFKFENSPDNTLDVPVVSDSIRTAFGITGGERSADLKGSISDGVLRRFADQVITNNLIRDETPNVKQAIGSKGYVPNFAEQKNTRVLDARTSKGAAMLVPSISNAAAINDISEGQGFQASEDEENLTFVKFKAFGFDQAVVDKKDQQKYKKSFNIEKIREKVKGLITSTGSGIVNSFIPFGEQPINDKQFEEIYDSKGGAKGSAAAVAGSVFETAIDYSFNREQSLKKVKAEGSTFDVQNFKTATNLKTVFSGSENTPEAFADYKTGANAGKTFANQILLNKAYVETKGLQKKPEPKIKKAVKGYIPNFAEQDYSWQQTVGEGEDKRRVEMYDWDGTIIETIKGDPKTYVKELENAKLLPLGRELAASKIPFDLVTGRPIEFKTKPKEGQEQEVIPFRDPIKQAAKRLGLNVRKVFSLGSMFESRRVMGEKGKERKLYGDERRALLAQKTNRSIVSGKEDNLTALGKYGIDANKINSGSLGFIPNFAEKREILAKASEFNTLDIADDFLANSTLNLQSQSPAQGLGKNLKAKILASARNYYGPNASVGVSRLPGRREAFTSALLANPELADDFIALQAATAGIPRPTLNTPEALALFNNPTPNDLPQKIELRPAIRAVGGKTPAIKKAVTKPLNAAFGYIPSFADPLKEAVDREISAGVNPSQVRVTKDDRLMTARNPEGLAVINTRDEPNGKVPSNRINEKDGRKAAAAKAFIPNFADPVSGKITAGLEKGPEINSDEFRAFRREVDRIARTFAETNKSAEELNAAFPKLKEDITNSANKFKVGQKTQDELIAASEKLKERTIQALSRPVSAGSVGASSGPTLGPGVVPGTSVASARTGEAVSPGILASMAGAVTTGFKNASGAVTGAIAAGLAAAKGVIPSTNPATTAGGAGSGGGSNDGNDKTEKKQGFSLDKTFYAFSGLTLAANALEQAFGKSESGVAKFAVGLANLTQSASQGALLGQSFGDLAKSLSEGKTGLLGTLGKVAGFAGPIGAAVGAVIGLANTVQEERNRKKVEVQSQAQKNELEAIQRETVGFTPEQRKEYLQKRLSERGQEISSATNESVIIAEQMKDAKNASSVRQRGGARSPAFLNNKNPEYASLSRQSEQVENKLLDLGERRKLLIDLVKDAEMGVATASAQTLLQEQRRISDLQTRFTLDSQIIAINQAFADKENKNIRDRAKAQSDFLDSISGVSEFKKRQLELDQKLADLDKKQSDAEDSAIKRAFEQIKNSSALATIDRERLKNLLERVSNQENLEDVEKEIKDLGIEGSYQLRNALQLLKAQVKEGRDKKDAEKDALRTLEDGNARRSDGLLLDKTSLEIARSKIKVEEELAKIRRDGAREQKDFETGTPLRELEKQIATQPFATREQRADLSRLQRTTAVEKQRAANSRKAEDDQTSAFQKYRSETSQSIDLLKYLGDKERELAKNRIESAQTIEDLNKAIAEVPPPKVANDPIQEKLLAAFAEKRKESEKVYNKTVTQTNETLIRQNALINDQITYLQQLDELRKKTPAKVGIITAFDEIRQESEEFPETFAKNTTLAFRDGMRDALSAAISQTDDLGAALQNVAMNFLKTMQNAFLQQASNQAMIGLQNAFPTVFPKGPAQGATGGFVSSGKIVKGYATGGLVTGGSGYKDDVPAMLSNGEYVIRRSSVEKYGAENLAKLNSGQEPPKFAMGGYVPRFAAGGDIFLPGVRGQTSISGYKDLTRFANQVTTSGSTDVMKGSGSSAFINLEDQSMRLSRFALLNEDDTVNQEIRSAQQQGLDLIKQREAYRTQQRKALQQQIIQTAASAVLSYGVGKLANMNFGPKPKLGLLDQAAGKTQFLAGAEKSSFLNFDASGKDYNALPSFNEKPSFLNSAPSAKVYNGLQGLGANSSFLNWRLPPGKAYGGMIQRYADGGPVDKTPALLMDGEYVMSNKAVKKHGKQFFDSLNQGRAPRFANGGEVGAGGEMLGEKFDNLSSKLETRGAPEVNITVNVTSSGSSETKSQGESAQGGIDYKKMSEKIKAVVLETINEEKRLGGSLRPRS